MRIARVSVQNFRCFSNSEKWAFNWLPKADLNLLIGPNGAGKTALVDAIDIVLNAEGRTNRTLITEYDFPCCDTTKTIMIEIVLVDIGTAIEKFTDYIQFFDKKDFEPIDDRDEIPDETTHERGVLIRFEGMFDKEEGEIQRKWILPKFRETEYEEMKELSRRQHDAIDYFRIQPAITGGAFTLGEYSALGRRLRKLNYKLGRLPDQLKPTQTLPQCKWDCENCVEEETCTAVVDHTDDEATSPQPLGKMMSAITDKAKSMLGVNAWSEMATSFGPRYGGLKTALAAITLGLRHPQAEEAFIPFERFSAGEKYALSFALAATTLTGSDTPIIVMEEPETALYPSAIGQIMANLQAKNSPQVVVTSHSEAVVRRLAHWATISLMLSAPISVQGGVWMLRRPLSPLRGQISRRSSSRSSESRRMCRS